jgi:hypothetical protein
MTQHQIMGTKDSTGARSLCARMVCTRALCTR